MRHARSLVSPAEALRVVFCPAVNTSRAASLLPVLSYHQQRSESSTSEASRNPHKFYRPSGVAPLRTNVPRSEREYRAREDNSQSFEPRTPRSFEPRSGSNGRPRENNDEAFGLPPSRSFGPRADSAGPPREDKGRSIGTAPFRSIRPSSDIENRPREHDDRSFGVPSPRAFGPRSDFERRPRDHDNRSLGVPPWRTFGPRSDSNNRLREDSYGSYEASLPQVFGPRSLRDGPLRDEAIRSRTVRIVSADNKIQEPSYLPDILASIDRKTHFVQQVSPVDNPEFPIPVCKIIDKKESREQERARAKAIKSSQQAASAKKLELSWGIGKHDLEHRMNKVREFLEDGRRVEIVVGASRRKGQAKKAAKIEAQEAAETFKTIREAVAGIDDVTEWKPMVGSVGTMATLYLEAKTRKVKGNKAERDGDSGD
ncbi:hypothetical protein MMC27_000591 [Xylographa pallens]|nr:hypothetical protein [Xylographa pallens]